MSNISREELNVISAAFRDIRKTVQEIRLKAPQVAALCDNIEQVSQPALKTIERAAERESSPN